MSIGSVISGGDVGDAIDTGINALQHPFFMVIFGIAFWFLFLWSIKRNKLKEQKIDYWSDQKDEILVTLMFGFMFLVWDDEIIQAYYDATDKQGHPELKIYYYLIVGPAVDRLYWLYTKATTNGSSH
jgi:hypothetical protein